jgi:hypothetical protein
VLASVWLQQNPRSVRAIQMMASYQADEGDVDGARRTLREGLSRVPGAGELAMQMVMLDCATIGVSRQQWHALVHLAGMVRNTHLVPETVARLGEEQRGGRCHDSLRDGDFRQLVDALKANPAISWQRETMGYLDYESSRQALHDHDLDQLMRDLDASNRLRPNPLVPREQAIYLLSAGLPDEAMSYLLKSEQTPQPWIKARLLDIRALNAPLWRSARAMKQARPPPR